MTKVYEGSEIQFKGCRGGPWEKRKVTSQPEIHCLYAY